MKIPTTQIIKDLQMLKAEIEWDYSIEYQILLANVIEILEEINGSENKE